MPIRALIRGAGDLASGVATRLFNSGIQVVMTEISQPTVVRRGASFAQAVYSGVCNVEGISGKLADLDNFSKILKNGIIPIIFDENNDVMLSVNPDVIIDARMLKSNQTDNGYGTTFVVGLGPGFETGENCNAVIETKRGHDLGRVIWKGKPAENTSVPGLIAGRGAERVLRAPVAGEFQAILKMGDLVNKGDKVGSIGEEIIVAPFKGVIRGLLANDIKVHKNMKVGDIDPRGNIENCFTISDKARSIGGGVLEAILSIKDLQEKFN